MKKQNKSASLTIPKKSVGKAAKVAIHQLPSGVRGLDDILGGGIPEYSFNVIAGAPGCGKTTLAHQIAFANGTAKKPALYFTVLGEPVIIAVGNGPKAQRATDTGGSEKSLRRLLRDLTPPIVARRVRTLRRSR